VAESGLIAAYLAELRFSAARLPDVDDIVDEAEDHLMTALEAAVARGQARPDAEVEVLARFGSAALVARVFVEEAKRGGAVSTTLTRRAGLAAMLAPPTMVAGIVVADIGASEQPLSGIGVGLALAAVAGFAYGLFGLRRRHGGLGALGRVAFWLAIVAFPVCLPFGYAGLVVLAVEVGVVVILYGVAMLRAGILPKVRVALFAFSWPAWAPLAWAITAAGDDANKYAIAPAAVTLAAFMALGLAMWREPALDAPSRTRAGPLAAG
jgi:hypothetical protein